MVTTRANRLRFEPEDHTVCVTGGVFVVVLCLMGCIETAYLEANSCNGGWAHRSGVVD